MRADTAPADLLRHGLRLLQAKDVDGWVNLWDEDAILEFPFAPGGRPKRLEGRVAVAAYMSDYPDHIDLHDFPHAEIMQTLVPDAVVVEMHGVGRLADTDRHFGMSSIAVVADTNGLITRYRDYWNPLAVQDPATHFAGSTA
ncbi:nuclear transport factor 2 family protein [Streptomyces sp. NPDC058620]|uniref:nuclear transport factor 2 family protein n=1 Tax=Streptomyces sp. NPDC058620 TaxID=3346560 RepID=UPI0036646D92